MTARERAAAQPAARFSFLGTVCRSEAIASLEYLRGRIEDLDLGRALGLAAHAVERGSETIVVRVDRDHGKLASLPEVVVSHLGHRHVETPPQAIFQASQGPPLVLE